MFGQTSVPATFYNPRKVNCVAPAHASGSYGLELSQNGHDYTDFANVFRFYHPCRVNQIVPISGGHLRRIVPLLIRFKFKYPRLVHRHHLQRQVSTLNLRKDLDIHLILLTSSYLLLSSSKLNSGYWLSSFRPTWHSKVRFLRSKMIASIFLALWFIFDDGQPEIQRHQICQWQAI